MAKRVTKGLSLVFGLSFMSWSMFNSINASFWAYFMTDVVGIAAATMGIVLVVSRGLDWLLVPVAGIFIEKINLKWGKYRSWLLIAPPIIFVLFVLMFTNPNIPLNVKAIYLASAYIIAAVFINLNMIAISTLIPVLGKTQEDRVVLAARKGQGSTLAKIVFGMTALPLILLINGGEKAAQPGYVVACLVFGAFFLVTYWALFRMTAEYDTENVEATKKKEKVSISEMLVLLVTNPPLLVLVLAETSRYIAQMVLMGMAMYYFQYAFNNVAMMAVMLTSMNLVGFGGTLAVEYIAQKIDKRTTYMIGQIIMCVCLGLAWLIARDALTFVVLISIGWFGFNFMNGTSLALQSDCVLYSEWKTGKSAKAFMMGMFQWCPKIGNIVAGAVTGFGLAAIGYTKGIAATPELITGLRNLINLLPVVALIIGLVLMLLLYKLNSSKMQEIQKDLQERSEASI